VSFSIGLSGTVRQVSVRYKGARRRLEAEERKALRRVAIKIAKIMIPEIPVGPTKNLRKSVDWDTNGRGLSMRVGPSNRRKGYHSHLVQAGSKGERRQAKSGRSTGRMPKNDYLGRTEKKSKQLVEQELGGRVLDKVV